MIRRLQIWLWGIVAEVEFILYPWKSNDPPSWAVERYNLDHNIVDEFENHMYYDWIKQLEDRTARLQLEMISVQNQINDLKDKPDV